MRTAEIIEKKIFFEENRQKFLWNQQKKKAFPPDWSQMRKSGVYLCWWPNNFLKLIDFLPTHTVLFIPKTIKKRRKLNIFPSPTWAHDGLFLLFSPSTQPTDFSFLLLSIIYLIFFILLLFFCPSFNFFPFFHSLPVFVLRKNALELLESKK